MVRMVIGTESSHDMTRLSLLVPGGAAIRALEAGDVNTRIWQGGSPLHAHLAALRLLGHTQIVKLIRPEDKTADVLLSGHPLRVAIAKHDIGAIYAVVVAFIRKIFIAPVGARARVILIINDPDI